MQTIGTLYVRVRHSITQIQKDTAIVKIQIAESSQFCVSSAKSHKYSPRDRHRGNIIVVRRPSAETMVLTEGAVYE